MKILFLILFSFNLWAQDQNAPEAQPSQDVIDEVAKELAAVKAAKAENEKILKEAMEESSAPKEDWAKNMYKTGVKAKETPEQKAAKEKANSFSESIKKTIAGFQTMSIIELENHIKITFKDTKYNPWFNKYPFFVTFIAQMLRSPDALPQLAKILDQKDKLIKFTVAFFFTFIVGMLLKRMVPAKTSFLLKVTHFFLRSFILTAIRLGLLIYLFQAEIAPAWALFYRHVFKNLFF